MERTQELELHIRESHEPNSSDNTIASPKDASVTNQHKIIRRGGHRWWFMVSLYSLLTLVGQSAATLLGRFYFDNGGNSKWLATFVQSGGFPILIPFLVLFSSRSSSMPNTSHDIKTKSPSFAKLSVLYVSFGIAVSGDNLMYSYGLLYLPVSTYSLLCATQLAFNAVFSYFFNALKLTPYVLNSLVLLTISASVLGLQGNSSDPSNIPKGKYIVGFLCTIGASALYSLVLSLTQVFFDKIVKKETFVVVLKMQIYTAMVATCICVVGLFASGEWRELKGEMQLFKTGRVSYVMTLAWTAVLWQVFAVSSLGLIFEASSLFSNVISTVCLPIVPILAVILFHDKMDGMKVVAMVLAIWGFVSYVFEHYLDYSKLKAARTNTNDRSVF
ncbi:hypothetical protein AQUCO_01400410v1 [Aquilegia coerulea]|uniref:Probable purine permease n=1 Tax=Aquilegia coerulea TaxID=218851 RepID=A0A2G5DWG1_AQUCA|nr:hypothetical protein AQUCO_01400410v1 [Aquilegia coerulea]